MTARAPAFTHPRTFTRDQWRAKLGAFASRGETTGPRVDEARTAVEWHRNRALLIDHVGMAPDDAEQLLDAMANVEPTDAEAVES